MSFYSEGFMTAKDLHDAQKYLDLPVLGVNDFQRICETMSDDNRVYNSKYDFEYHKSIKLMRRRMYGGLLPR